MFTDERGHVSQDAIKSNAFELLNAKPVIDVSKVKFDLLSLQIE